MLKKKILVLFAAVAVMTASVLGGCNNRTEGDPSSQVAEESVVTTQESSEESTEESTVESTTESTEEKTEPETKEPFVADRSAVFELLSHINVGWNLGNTLDSIGAGKSTASETYWGNPKTTQEMMDAIAAQGFTAVRIPITYAEHVGSAPDYSIREDWLKRVQEIVDYALNANLYVIIDTHHEPDYWLKPNSDYEEQAVEELAAIWKQVAERFRDYDERLLFEGMNEPRIKGSSAEWSGGTQAERKVVDRLNQTFIDAVRSTGGNNETRVCIICTYGNNPGYNIIKELKIPEDNYIAVAVHMYTPYYFTYDVKDYGYSNWDGSGKGDIAGTVKQLDKYFIKNDVPVLVTEFGAVNKKNSEEVIKWIADYLGVMNTYGIKCFWWDNGCYTTTGENFGIFNRKQLTWYDQAIADALIEYSVKE